MKFLGPTLKSLDDQQIGRLRVSICDDSSTDESFEVVSAWAKTTRHDVVLSRNELNKGPSETYESAVANTDSKFVVILSQDDTLQPGHISNLRSLAEGNSDVAAVMPVDSAVSWQVQLKAPLRKLITSSAQPGWSTVLSLLGSNTYLAPGTLVRREYWIPGTMQPANMQAQDYELWLYLALRGRLVRTKQPVLYRIHENNLHDCDPMDRALDIGLTFRRFLNSSAFIEQRSKLEPKDRVTLDNAVRERLTVHLSANPVIYALATMDSQWESIDVQSKASLKFALSKALSRPPSLLGWDRNERAEVLVELRNWNNKTNQRTIDEQIPLRSSLSKPRPKSRAECILSDRRANRRVRRLAYPWVL
jgi:glycosyltransferase involved in cell wall biosynthesis